MAGRQEASFLLRGAQLGQYEEWAGTTSLALTADERLYLEASLVERRRQEAEESDRRRRELQLERRSRNFLRGLVAVFAVAAIVALALTWVARRAQSQALAEAHGRATQQVIAEDARREADEQRQAALLQASAGLAARALAELDGSQPERGVLLALAALEEYPYMPQAESALAQAVQQVYSYQDFAPKIENYPDVLIYSYVFTPDDQQIIAYFEGYDTSWVTLLDVASGEIIRAFQLESYCGYAGLALTPDGKRLAVVHQNNPPCLLAIWDLIAEEKILTLNDQPEAAAYDAAWSPDGRFLLTGSLDGIARVWEMASGEVIHKLTGHTGPVRAVAWSPDGRSLATGGEDGTVRLWDARTGAPISSSQGHIGPVLSLDWSPSGELLASSGADGLAQVWDAATGLVRRSLRGHSDQIGDVAWLGRGEHLATSSRDGTLRIWNPLTGEQLLRMETLPLYTSLDASSYGDRLIYSSPTRSLRLLDLSQRIVRLVGHTGTNVNDAQWSPDGQRIATAGTEDGTVRIWDWPAGELINTLEDLPAGGYYLAWSPDGRRLAITTFLDVFSVWDTITWRPLWELPSSAEDWLYVSGWSPDGERLSVAAAPGYYTLILDAKSGQVLTRIDSDRQGWLHLRNQSWAPQGDRFVAGTLLFNDDKTPARVWDAASGKTLLELPEQAGNTVIGAYSPDGRFIATTSLPGVIRVWDAASGQPVSPAVSLSGQTIDLHWSPNGKRIAVGSANGHLIVLDAMTGAEVARYTLSPGQIPAVDWSPDGKNLLTLANTNPQPYIFPAWQTTEELIAYAKECCVWRELTAEEREQFGLP